MKKALLVVDIQNDFCKGGALEVPDANEIIPYVNGLLEEDFYDEIIFTQDWHPVNHLSFASNNGKNVGDTIAMNGVSQLMWPNHCIQNTFGADIHKELNVEKATHIIKKGTHIEIDSYSCFQDNNHFYKTGLSHYLKANDVQMLEVVGLALDYCVKYTCLDAIREGFITCLHFKGTKAVNIKPNNGRNAIYEMLENGVSILG